MAKKSTSKKTSKTRRSRAGSSGKAVNAQGKHLVIVESPAKAKTINKYLGKEYVVQASVGHVRDLPAKAEKGKKQPVPGVDLENQFQPTYTVLPGKKKVLADLKKAAKQAIDVWFATDFDREGEAIAWHIAQELKIEPEHVKRVVFNAITKSDIAHAFANPLDLDLDQINAQQARRILDRIVGYQVSPLLWKKVARGLSAGRVQSVAVRLVVEREREIREFKPSEYWRFTARLTPDIDARGSLEQDWARFILPTKDQKKSPTIKEQNAWLAEHGALKAELVELDGDKFDLSCKADQSRDLTSDVIRIAEAIGLTNVSITTEDNPSGKGLDKTLSQVAGTIDPSVRYRVKSIATKKTNSRPGPPFITSTLQMGASNVLSFGTQRTMRIAQGLYEGVVVPGEGQVGLITYMRTDSPHLSQEAINQVRGYIKESFDSSYLPASPHFYDPSSKRAQEAHEAIRPTDVNRHPDDLKQALTDDQWKLYRLIWNRFVACQMAPAQWDATTVMLERSDQSSGAILKAAGRVLVFDGFYRVTGVPAASDEQILPVLQEYQETAPFALLPEQQFTSPPPRYSEASLVKTLESEGIGRPSTYASIINVIQQRKYVEQINRRFFATDLGEVVTDKLVEAFPRLMDVGYTRAMETELDKVAEQHHDWVTMLEKFYQRFSQSLDRAHENLVHAKAEIQPAPYMCPKCQSQTCYRFGKNGRFLSCGSYPDCDYAAPLDREGRPLSAARVNVACPEDGSPMELRTGRFGKFLASMNYPDTRFVINLDKKDLIKYPSQPPLPTDIPCPKCDAHLNLRKGKRGPWLSCSAFPKCRGRGAWTKLDEDVREHWQARLDEHDKKHPQIVIRTLDGDIIKEGTPISELTIPGGVVELKIHPDSEKTQSTEAA